MDSEQFFLGNGPDGVATLLLKQANRHGLVAGATGTGKTVTLKVLAESFSAAGVPVFAADIKGDLSGIASPGEPKSFLSERAAAIGLSDLTFAGCPTVFWDIFGLSGHPVRTTVSDMGPLLLSRLMNLTEAQEGILSIAFRVADDEGMLVLDLKDLRALLQYCADGGDHIRARYGNVARASVGAIQRKLLTMESEGAENFFGEPALDLHDLMRTDRTGRGIVNILSAEDLIHSPRLYSTLLLWLLSELFETLPETGDLDRPRLVFFFDEAHLLFNDTPKALVDKILQVVRLIRSKGVGVYFVTQSPGDLPDAILAQLGNRIQHALRAYTPGERKSIKAVADGFRPNPAFKAADIVTELRTGEALVSTLDAKGAPTIVARTLIRPPSCSLGPVSAADRATILRDSPVRGRYEKPIDRDSAYEILARRATAAAPPPQEKAASRAAPARSRGGSLTTTVTKTVLRTISSEIGRRIARGILGSLFKR